MPSENRFAWLAWDTEYPDEGSVPVFTETENNGAALACAIEALGYDDESRTGHDPEEYVHVERAPHLDRYAATGDVPEIDGRWPSPEPT